MAQAQGIRSSNLDFAGIHRAAGALAPQLDHFPLSKRAGFTGGALDGGRLIFREPEALKLVFVLEESLIHNVLCRHFLRLHRFSKSTDLVQLIDLLEHKFPVILGGFGAFEGAKPFGESVFLETGL